MFQNMCDVGNCVQLHATRMFVFSVMKIRVLHYRVLLQCLLPLETTQNCGHTLAVVSAFHNQEYILYIFLQN